MGKSKQQNLGLIVGHFHHLATFLVLFSLSAASIAHANIPTLPGLPWPQTSGPHHSAKPEIVPVSCSQAYSISKWSHSKFGGPKPTAYSSQKFASKVAHALIDKWDPYRVLHTASEIRKIETAFKANWEKFSKNRSCLALSLTIENHLETLRLRLAQAAKTISVKDVLPTTFKTAERHHEPQLFRYHQFANDEKTLTSRMQEQVKISLQGLTVRWWDVVGKDGKKLVATTLENKLGLDADRSANHWLLLGALGALDPYSTYLTDPEFEDLTRDLSGVASGIGIRVRVVPSGLLIRQVLTDSPAGKSGELAEGDLILEVDGKELLPLADQRKQDSLRGEAGQSIQLKIQKNDGSVKTVQLSRQEINLEDAKVSYHFFPLRGGEGDVAILRIPSFYAESGWNFRGDNKSCALDVEKALMEIAQRRRKVAAVVLDLRGNPGGFLEEAVSMAGLFLGNQPVVGVANGQHVKILRNYHRKPLYAGPLVVALDPDSASASEVLAGALRDNGRAVVVTESHSYGKGSVQRLFSLREVLDSELPLPKTSKVGAVKLTTSLFFSPKGVSPEGTGVEADILVGEKREATNRTAYKMNKVKEAALASTEKADSLIAPLLSARMLKELESKSRERSKSTQETLGQELSKLLSKSPDTEVSPGLVEAVAVARDFHSPAVAAKN